MSPSTELLSIPHQTSVTDYLLDIVGLEQCCRGELYNNNGTIIKD